MPYLITAFPIFSLTLKCGIKSICSLIYEVLYKDKGNSRRNIIVLEELVVNKNIKSERKFWRQSV